jgi:hypothetical protein
MPHPKKARLSWILVLVLVLVIVFAFDQPHSGYSGFSGVQATISTTISRGAAFRDSLA